VTTREMHQPSMGCPRLAQVTTPSDGVADQAGKTSRPVRATPPQAGCVRRAPKHATCTAPAPSPGRSHQGLNPRNRLPTGSDLGGHTACRGGQRCNNGTKREWCPASLAVPGSPRRSGRTETLT
jgi:hypothetical protein